MTAGRKRSSMAFIAFLFLLARLPAHSETLKISATGRSFTQLPIRIAQVKGFYRDEEPEVVYVQMTGQLATASLFGGHVDATTAFSASATGDTKEPTDSKLRPRIIDRIRSRAGTCRHSAHASLTT
jgi:ABC-type nitrate/sulfonate/bicarbonate transport system substrate-binding protein